MLQERWPIVFVHSSESPLDRFFLARTIAQVKHSNPHASIHLICDLPYDFSFLCCQHPWKNYLSLVSRFREVYDHMSATSEWYDRACISRWLLLSEFCRLNSFKSVIYIESDVLIYSDLSFLQKIFSESSMSLSLKCSSPVNFIPDISILCSFSQFVIDFYRPDNASCRATLFQEISADMWPGMVGISDMTLLLIFSKIEQNKSLTFAPLEKIYDGGKFDHNINVAEGGERMGLVRKSIEMLDGIPFSRTADGTYVRMHSLHFQGSKSPLERFLTLTTDPAKFVEVANSVDILIEAGRSVSLAERPNHKYLGEGWEGPEEIGICARGATSWFIFDLPPGSASEYIKFELKAKATYGRTPWKSAISLGEILLSEFTFTDSSDQTISVSFKRPFGMTRFRIALRHEDTKSPMELGISPVDWRDITLFVYSFLVDFPSILLDGVDKGILDKS